MQIAKKALVQTGFKSEITEKLVSLLTKKKNEILAIDTSQPRFSGKFREGEGILRYNVMETDERMILNLK